MQKAIFFSFILLANTFLFSQTKEKQLLVKIGQADNAIKKYNLTFQLAQYYKEKNIVKADSIKDVLIAKSIRFDDTIRLNALIYKSEIEFIKGDLEAYFITVLGCHSFLNRMQRSKELVIINQHLGNYHLLNREYDMANFYLKRMLREAVELKSKHYIAKSHLLIGKNFTLNNFKDSALYHIDKSIQYARRTSDKSLLAFCFHQQARTYTYFDQLELGIAKDILALQIATKNRNHRQIAIFSIFIGQAQLAILNYQDASYYFHKAIDQAKKVHDLRQISLAQVALAEVYFNENDLPRALTFNELAIESFKELNNQEGLALANNMFGLIYKENQDFDKSIMHFNQALINFESFGDVRQIAKVYINVASIFYAQKKYRNTINYLEKSLKISKDYGFQKQEYENYRILSDVYKSIGKPQKALNYLTLYTNYSDSNNIQQAVEKIAELNELYLAEQRNKLILLQADSIEHQRQERQLAKTKLENFQLRSNMQKYIIFAFIVVIILSGVILNFRWKQTKFEQQQREAEMSQTLLRSQMNPHFVFNAMSIIQSYIYDNDTQNSTKFLLDFSKLMRLILENSPKEEIPITVEEEILQKYLAVQKLRFEDRFDYTIEIDESLKEEDAMIPPMITQPFIENSIEHGQLHTIEGGYIHIEFKKKGEMLEISIEDNGVGREHAKKNQKELKHKSMALNITHERIAIINRKYKAEGNLVIEDLNKTLKTGTKVLISLPYRVLSQNLNQLVND